MAQKPFRIGVNMAGAVSAGAYTAGVLDFLIEALDDWYDAKEKFSKGQGNPVPMHDISLDVFSGASAGGMCAAIASVMVQGEFAHIHDTSLKNTTNRFYESWVNKIDIRELLKQEDLKDGGPVASLLDCTIIDEIAEFALQPGTPKKRVYISPNLTLFLTLTNLTGIPYALDDNGPVEESTLYYPDRLRFETVRPGNPTTTPVAKPLPLGRPDQGAWGLLRETAKATGAFPIFLAPRMLEREKLDYQRPMWQSVNPAANQNAPAILPAGWKTIPEMFNTINVDGGVMDNDPFDLAHDYLASFSSRPEDAQKNQNPRDPIEAEAAVLTVVPFPSSGTPNFSPNFVDSAAVPAALGSLVSAVIAQSRFFGESLALIAQGSGFSRFTIAPSDDSLPPGVPSLQCASLGAFGGFFERKFRAHDYLLGRRNCQLFLQKHFVLPARNPIMKDALGTLDGKQSDVIGKFKVSPPKGGGALQNEPWLPLIPLCSKAVTGEAPKPPRAQIGEFAVSEVVTLIYERARAVIPALGKDIAAWPIRAGIDNIVNLIGLLGLGKNKLTEYLLAQLNDQANSSPSVH
ncbi:MAG TPA: patatin-like phospholipase family protein [Candidatus Acidoferrum sp.]|nr:patatin-like phospholipase family protein [Candidatus Acidoferrum sp.]